MSHYQGRFERQNPQPEPKPKKKGLVILLIILAILLLLVAGAYFAITKLAGDMWDKTTIVTLPVLDQTQPATDPLQETDALEIQTEPTETTVETTAPHVASSEDYINILVVGQAAREGEMERRADTAILVTINPYEKSVVMTSFLRDTLVHGIPYQNKNIGYIKLTTMYHLGSFYMPQTATEEEKIAGSMALMNQVLYNNFGVEVDYNVEIDFNAFIKFIDLLGGIRVELTEEEARYMNSSAGKQWIFREMEAGETRLWGNEALFYARIRKADGDGESDIKRTARQRNLITLIIQKLARTSPAKIMELADEILPMIATTISKDDFMDLMTTLIPILPDLKITGGVCPTSDTSSGKMKVIYKETGTPESVVEVYDWDLLKQQMRAITEGEIIPDPTATTAP